MKLGCNYWASNAGTEMWRQFDTEVIENDFKVLREHGVEYLRVFPNWRDFQPVEPLYSGGSTFERYQLSGDRKPTNKYYLDDDMLDEFGIFCDLAEKYDMKLIVGLLTGWMSGRMFIPPIICGKNVVKDPECLYFEQLYIEGLVETFKDKAAIYAWDHGNECHCMGGAENFVDASMWTRMLSNAVRAHDTTRPLITGINGLTADGTWRFDEQADVCDMLVTHPYPLWGTHTKNDRMNYIRTTLYSAAINKLYSDLGKKPCFIEETGTMGPCICSEDFAADFLRVNYFSSWANGNDCLLWWCANEQDMLMTTPYTWTMVENELGMRFSDGSPKPVLKEMKRLSEIDIDLPEADTDAVCLLTADQDGWGVSYMTYVLSKQAGLNIEFADANKEIPESDVYMMPSIKGSRVLSKENYLELKKRVYNGAKLYISYDGGILMGFEDLTGNKVLDSEFSGYSDTITINGKEIPFNANMHLYYENTRSEQIDTPHITVAPYGKGKVYFVDFPVEAMLIDKHRAFSNNVCEIYKKIFKDEIDSHIIKVNNENVALTIHQDGDRVLAIAVNHSECTQKIDFVTDCELVKVHYGNIDSTKALDAVLVEFKK